MDVEKQIAQAFREGQFARRIATNKQSLTTRFPVEHVPYKDLAEHAKSGYFRALVIDVDDQESDGLYSPRVLRRQMVTTPVVGLSEDLYIPEQWSERAAEFLNQGGDYLLRSPENPQELDASILAADRRVFRGRTENIVRSIEGLTVNLSLHTVSVNGVHIHLTGKETEMMVMLAENITSYVATQAFMNELYHHESEEPEVKILDVYICKIRAKLNAAKEGLGEAIVTVWGKGYRLEKEPTETIKSPGTTTSETE